MAAFVVATGQITITDYNDAVPITWSIATTQPQTQRISVQSGVTTCTPDWRSGTGVNQVLTATFTAPAGITLSSLQYQWQKLSAGTWSSATESGNTTVALTINTNLTESVSYRCVFTYTYLSVINTFNNAEVTLSSIPEGSTTPWAELISETGKNTFISTDSATSYITLVAKLYANVAEDVANNYYKWYYWDFAGPAWVQVTNTSNNLSNKILNGVGATSNYGGVAADATAMLTAGRIRVLQDAIPNARQFKVEINSTGVDAVPFYTGFIELYDRNDNWQVQVTCVNPIFRNGESGSKIISAYVTCDGAQVVDQAALTAKVPGAYIQWFAYGATGTDVSAVANLDGGSSGNPIKTCNDAVVASKTFSLTLLDTHVSLKLTVWAVIMFP